MTFVPERRDIQRAYAFDLRTRGAARSGSPETGDTSMDAGEHAALETFPDV